MHLLGTRGPREIVWRKSSTSENFRSLGVLPADKSPLYRSVCPPRTCEDNRWMVDGAGVGS
eukprot:scaffold73410_cov35-Tisochrysis_lutea.AAC.1